MHTGQLIDSQDTDGLGVALRRQSARIGPDSDRRKAESTSARAVSMYAFTHFDQCEVEDPSGSGGVAFVYEADCRQIKPAAKLTNAAIIQQAYANLSDTSSATAGAGLIGYSASAASGAALVGTKPRPDAETWHTEAPTVAGVYIAQDIPVDAGRTYYMRFHGSEGWGAHHDTIEQAAEEEEGWGKSRPIVWLRLVRPDQQSAKPAALPGWRRGPDVPASERNGLWFVRAVDCPPRTARLGSGLFFHPSNEYRPAPPGVREGDKYDPALYGE